MSQKQFTQSESLRRRAHQIIPGGCHTYAKGDDQFPYLSPGFIDRGEGCHVWDVDGNEYIEYGMGCRAVSLGHAFKPVTEAVADVLSMGTNFTRPAALELECAEELLGMLPAGEMCKFAKDGSTVTTAAIKLARAFTGRERVALCRDHPFFAIHDWFIGTTPMSAGIPQAVQDLSLTFRYDDLDSLTHLFEKNPNQIACVIMEAAKYGDPSDGYLQSVVEACHRHGALFILDEMITGFRWSNGGAQEVYGIDPDFSTFGKALANGFSLSALIGKRKYMEAAGIYHDRNRVFALSTTHGAESTGLAAALATMRFYQQNPVIEVLDSQGEELAVGLRSVIQKHQLDGRVGVIGRPSNMVFTTSDSDGKPSQAFRCLLMQELIKRGVLGPSLVISYSHTDEDIQQTINAFDGSLSVYREALAGRVEDFLVGPASQTVYRMENEVAFQTSREVPSS